MNQPPRPDTAPLPLDRSVLLDALQTRVPQSAEFFMAGSLADQRTHPGADIDLYALLTEPGSQVNPPEDEPNVVLFVLDGQDIDLEIWSRRHLEALLDRYTAPVEGRLIPITFKERLLLESLRIALPLEAAPLTERLRGQLEQGHFRAHEVERRYQDWRKSRRVIADLMLGDFLLPAFTELSLAVHSAADAYLIARGNYNPHRRWLFQRFDQLDAPAPERKAQFIQHQFPVIHQDSAALRQTLETSVSFLDDVYAELRQPRQATVTG